MGRLIFGMDADRVDLPRIADLVTRYGDDNGWDEFMVMKVNLLLEELALNVQHHGQVSGRRFDVEIASAGGQVSVDFTDDGVPFDPMSDAPEPDLVSGAGERRLGGLGVHLVRSLSGRVDYRYENGRNVLSLALCA